MARVTFGLSNGVWADTIYLVGDFNGWDRTSHPLKRDDAGNWSLTIDLEVGRAFQFRYLCDCDHWLNDMYADAFVMNPYGSDNFVVITDPLFKQYCDRQDVGVQAENNSGSRQQRIECGNEAAIGSHNASS